MKRRTLQDVYPVGYVREEGKRWKPPATGGFHQCHALWDCSLFSCPHHALLLFRQYQYWKRDQDGSPVFFPSNTKKTERSFADVVRASASIERLE